MKTAILYEVLIILIVVQLLGMAVRFYLEDEVGMPLTQHERTYGGSNGVTIK